MQLKQTGKSFTQTYMAPKRLYLRDNGTIVTFLAAVRKCLQP